MAAFDPVQSFAASWNSKTRGNGEGLSKSDTERAKAAKKFQFGSISALELERCARQFSILRGLKASDRRRAKIVFCPPGVFARSGKLSGRPRPRVRSSTWKARSMFVSRAFRFASRPEITARTGRMIPVRPAAERPQPERRWSVRTRRYCRHTWTQRSNRTSRERLWRW
jgi:hypothetical protein